MIDSCPVRAWLRLLRVPNLLTAPGDSIAGLLLATGASVLSQAAFLCAAAAGLLFYTAGLLLNDWADIEEDRVQRPDRPLPSGAVPKQMVLLVAVAVFLVGEFLCVTRGPLAIAIGLGLSSAIVAYNLSFKRFAGIGPFTMGACRGLSLLLGAAVMPVPEPFPPAVCVAALILTLYIATVTQLARHETESRRSGPIRWLPVTILLAVAIAFLLAVSPATRGERFLCAGGFLLAGMAGVAGALRLGAAAPRVPPVIGLWVSGLLFLQAGFVAGAGTGVPGIAVSVILILLWPWNRWLARRFSAS